MKYFLNVALKSKIKQTSNKVIHLSTLSNNNFVIFGTINQNDLKIGDYNELTHEYTKEDVLIFSKLSGDSNPLHIDDDFAKKTIFGRPIVHGILVSSLFSTLFGKSIDGSIYVSQTLNFKKPVYMNSKVSAKVQILSIDKKRKGNLITCSTVCKVNDEIVIDGEAKVLVPTTDK